MLKPGTGPPFYACVTLPCSTRYTLSNCFMNAPEAQLSHAIGTAGLTDWVSTLPDGLDTLISENGKNLSGGQRQRIGIARLALRRYDLIIADEITASLDPDTSGQVMENLLALLFMLV